VRNAKLEWATTLGEIKTEVRNVNSGMGCEGKMENVRKGRGVDKMGVGVQKLTTKDFLLKNKTK